MDIDEAVFRILKTASRIVLPSDKRNVVSIARSQFSRNGSCDARYVQPIEDVIDQLLEKWTWKEKDEIWQSTDTSGGEPYDREEIFPGIDLALHNELLEYVAQQLSSGRRKSKRNRA